MGLDSVIPSYVDRPGIEVGLHDAEAVFNDPAAAIQSDDGRCGVLKVSAQGIEAVEAGLLVYHLLIERVAFYLGEFAVRGAVLGLDEALGVIRTPFPACIHSASVAVNEADVRPNMIGTARNLRAVPFCFSLGLESSTDRAVFMDEPVSPST